MIAGRGTYLRYIVGHENNNEARNSTPRFLISSCVQDPPIGKALSGINHSQVTAPVYVIATKLHFYLRSYESGLSNSRGHKVTRTPKTRNVQKPAEPSATARA